MVDTCLPAYRRESSLLAVIPLKKDPIFQKEKKKHGRKWDTWELEAFLKSPLVCAPLGPGLAGPGADSLPQVFIHSKKIFFSKYLKTMP